MKKIQICRVAAIETKYALKKKKNATAIGAAAIKGKAALAFVWDLVVLRALRFGMYILQQNINQNYNTLHVNYFF